MIYLDYAATTPMTQPVIEAMNQAMRENYGNASSTYRIGRQSHEQLTRVRENIAETINAQADDIIFTSGATESTNSALIQTAKRLAKHGRHIITTEAEHPSSYKTAKYLEKQGFEVTFLPFDEYGHISIEALKDAIKDDTIMVSIIAGNNEVGSVQDIQAIGDICQDHHLFFYTDVVQAYLNVPIDVEAMHIDGLCVSAHKFHGPKGVGFLYYRNAVSDFTPYLRGGGQEHGHRAGTENVPGIVAMGKAIEIAYQARNDHHQKLLDLRNYFLKEAKARGLEFEINGPKEAELAHILNVYWPNHPSDQVLIKLDLKDVYVSAGSACSAGSLEPSRILVSMFGKESPRISQSIRISFGQLTTIEEIDKFLDILLSIA